MKKTTFFLSLLLLSGLLSAQTKDEFFKDYVSRIWNAEDDLPGNSITDICQDNSGYMYFGTYGGLLRFDGVKFITINKISDEKYSFLTARAVIQDSRGNIWVGSNDEGVCCLKTDGKIVSYTIDDGLPNNSVRSFCEDKTGNIWVGTASGITCISPDFTVQTPKGFETIPQDNHFVVTQIYCDTAGRIWIVTKSEKGLYVYANQKFEVYEGIHTVKNPIVTTMTQDSSGAYWFGVAPYYAVKVFASEEVLLNLGSGSQKGSVVTTIYQDDSKNLWFGLDNGITIFHDGILSYLDKTNGLADYSIVKIMQDREKNIWIGTDHGGIQKLSYGKFQTTPMSTTVNAIAQDKFRNVTWIAGDNGLYCYKDGLFLENPQTEYCKNVRIRHVSVTEDGALLVSTYEKFGQLKFNLNGSVENWTKEGGIAGDRIRVAEQFSNGDLYIGTTTGLSIIDGQSGEITNITTNSKINNDYIMCLYEDDEGNVWVGTDGGGVFVLKNKEVIKTYTKDDNLAGNVIFKISSFRDGEIWFCTGTGLSCMKDNKIFSFDAENGFAADGIFQIIPDFSGRLWGTSNRGIFYVKMDDVDSLIAGEKTVVNLKYYNRLDGITSGGVTSTSLSSKDDIGRIWFTLIDGFTIFDPVRNASNLSSPVVKIENVYVDSEKYDFSSGKIVIPPNAKRLIIEYTGITFVSSEQVSFKTMLTGFDDDYSDWTNIRQASYTNLKPGTYEFSVLSQNGDEVSCEKAAQLTIVKTPYLWQRPWFIILVIIFVEALILWFIFKKLYNLRKEKENSEKLLIEVTQALVGIIDAKDKYTNGHSGRVADYAKMLAAAMGESKAFQKELYYAALLHDIGKIGIPDTIISKPGKLTKEEYDLIKTHTIIGSHILSSISTMKDIAAGARNHHERYNGTGYPDKKMGENIPKIARFICVADAYDAMTSNRSYRNYMEQDVVRKEIEDNIGIQFDPEIAKKMLEIIDKDVDYKFHE